MCLAGKLSMTAVDVISILRVYALYGKNRKVLAFLIVMELCNSSFGFYALWRLTDFSEVPLPPRNELSKRFGCITLATANTKGKINIFMATWVITMYFGFTLFKLKAYLIGNNGRIQYRKLRDGKVFSPLMTAFFSDGASAFMFELFNVPRTGKVTTELTPC
ncbi:hypothetical protein MD484_g6291, partial [Candolleomyces efflorescens]